MFYSWEHSSSVSNFPKLSFIVFGVFERKYDFRELKKKKIYTHDTLIKMVKFTTEV